MDTVSKAFNLEEFIIRYARKREHSTNPELMDVFSHHISLHCPSWAGLERNICDPCE